jgi:transcriptional regulator with XRE-family HTH domain
MSVQDVIAAATKLPDQRAIPLRDVRATMAAIEAARAEAGLSVEALARLAGLSARSYQRYCSGARQPGGAELRRLARALAGREAQRPREEALLLALAARHLEAMAQALDPRGARNLAIYLAHVELGLPQKALARLYGVSGNRINMVVQRIEARRDDGCALDLQLMALSSLLDRDAQAFLRRGAA